jgi:hypothetical protein
LNPTFVDRPSFVFDGPDDDETSKEPAEASAVDTDRGVDSLAEDTEAGPPVASSPPPEEEVGAETVEVAQAEDDTGAEVVADRAEPVDGDEPAESGAARPDPDRHSDLLAWLVGDGESLADLLGPAKQPQTYAPPVEPPAHPAPRPLARPPRLDRESFRRATDATRPSAAPTAASPPRAPPAVGQSPRPTYLSRTVVLVAAITVAVALVAGIVTLLLLGSGSNDARTSGRGHSSPIAPPAQTADPVTWAKQNLLSGAAIVAPRALVPSLQAAGFTTVYADDALRGLGLTNVAYLVGEPTVTSSTGDLQKLINATAPLAYFGTGSAQTMVGQVFRGGTIAMAQAMLDDTKLRAEEGSELLKNPNVHTDVAMRKVLANGLLDARAGAMIVSLAGSGQVTITAPVRAAPEAAAGLPYRTFTVSMSNATFLDNSLHTANQKYKPATVVALGPNDRRLTWTPAVAPDKPFR